MTTVSTDGGFVPSHDIANNVFRPNASHRWQQGLRSFVLYLMLCQDMLKPMLYIVTRQRGEVKVLGGGGGRREEMVHEAGVFLPNSDLISEPEHTVCKDATRHGAAPLLSVGRLAL